MGHNPSDGIPAAEVAKVIVRQFREGPTGSVAAAAKVSNDLHRSGDGRVPRRYGSAEPHLPSVLVLGAPWVGAFLRLRSRFTVMSFVATVSGVAPICSAAARRLR